jgi:hypothetical protein
MEIGPIAGIRAMPVVKAPPADPELTAVFDIGNSARIGDETWTPSDKLGRGSEDDGSDDPLEDEEESTSEAARSGESNSAPRPISFFA